MAQVSVNITDFEQTAIHAVYEEICKDAEVKSFLFFFVLFFREISNSILRENMRNIFNFYVLNFPRECQMYKKKSFCLLAVI